MSTPKARAILEALGLAAPSPRWWEKARCHGQHDTFYPDDVRGPMPRAALEKAAAFCEYCPVWSDCLADEAVWIAAGTSDSPREVHGVRAGYTPAQRRALFADAARQSA